MTGREARVACRTAGDAYHYASDELLKSPTV